jgi:hypothetical protein
VNVESEVEEPISLAMLELVTRSRTPFVTRELIECLSKVLDGTLITCGSGIGRGLDVVFGVSFNTAIMSLVRSFKSWKQNNGVLISFCTTSCIWSWHSISWLVENYVCPSSLWCSSLLPPCQQGAFFFRVEKTKRLWHDCSSSSSLGNRTWTKCKSISLNYLPSGKNFRCHTNL